MSSLIHCIYASAASRPLETPAIASLLEKAREKNQRLGLTGMLLYTEGSFFQILEGEADAVDTLYAKILLDSRHVHVTKVLTEPISKRVFDNWSMGYSAATRAELASIPGLNDFFGKAQSFTAIDSGRAKKVLEAFAEGRWRQRLA
ncbi:MAG TPA: BLUF domain-containing protein [Polyangiales bacterium]|nr:BLUF domain-containing protein [Polyangiales bacterium]